MCGDEVQRVDSELLAGWRERLAGVRTMLAAQPESQWVWLWRVQSRILTFLVSRYSQGPPGGPGVSRPATPSDQMSYPTRPRRPAPLISPLLPPLAAGYGTQPRGPADLRPALQRVHYVNQGVRQMWPQLATSWPPPPPPFSIGRHELPPEQRAALEACAWGIAATLEHDAANALGLTDAAILIVLSGDR